MPPLDLREDCRKEIDRHKWIVSYHAGRDVGNDAVNEWIREHWLGYLRARCVEHVLGRRRWSELRECDYGLLQREFQDRALLLDRIVDRWKVGQENLHIINWALDWHIPIDDVIDILTAIDINGRRMAFQFYS
ncbi:MAG: hypothetical protein EXR98_04125 [Gemmataceae bacterium]|nr:hypothetical protein [Gemmataceae bacterium]